jgi:hypothetical protein
MTIIKLNSISQFLIFASAVIFSISISSISNTALAKDADLTTLQEQITELQELLLNPEKTQLAVLLSVDPIPDFNLDSVSLYLDNKKTKTYLYSKRESDALISNATQKIYVGDLSEGEHIIKAQVSAIDKGKQNYKISSSSKFTKTETTKFVELKISKSEQQELPVLNIKIWE